MKSEEVLRRDIWGTMDQAPMGVVLYYPPIRRMSYLARRNPRGLYNCT